MSENLKILKLPAKTTLVINNLVFFQINCKIFLKMRQLTAKARQAKLIAEQKAKQGAKSTVIIR